MSVTRAISRSVSSPPSSSARSRLVWAVVATVSSWRAPSRIRSASRSPSARGMGSRSASRRSAASTARWASIGSDLPFPRRALRLGCSHSMTVRPAAATARASPTPKLRVPSIDTTTRGPGRMVDDPGQQLGKAGVVIADLSCPDRSAGRERDLHLVGVAVGVDTDDGVDKFCQHGHRPSPSCREWVNVGTGLGGGHRVAHL